MNRYLSKLTLLGLAAFLGGCNTAPPAEGATSPPLDSAIESVPLPIAALPDSVRILPFELKDWESRIDWDGKLRDGAQWVDKSGKYVLLITDYYRGEISDVSLVARVNARKYIMEGDSLKLIWEVKESNQDYFTNPEYRFKTLEVSDLDQDGVAESSFIYTIDSDGGGPVRAKLILHVLDQKYAIRGQFAGMDIDVGEIEEKHFGPEFTSISPVFKSFASGKWDRFEKVFYDSWKGE